MTRETKKRYFKKKKTRNNKKIRKQRRLKNSNNTRKRKQSRKRKAGLFELKQRHLSKIQLDHLESERLLTDRNDVSVVSEEAKKALANLDPTDLAYRARRTPLGRFKQWRGLPPPAQADSSKDEGWIPAGSRPTMR